MKLLLTLTLLLIFSAFGGSSERIAYQGRLLQATGAPVVGPVDLTFKLYKNADVTVQCVQTISGVAISQGLFGVELTFPALCNGGKTFSEFLYDSATANDLVYLEVTDDTNVKTYNKQAMTATTYSYVSLKLAGSIDATQVADGSVDDSEYQHLDGVTSNIQTQLNAKQTSGSYQALDADLTDLADGSLTGSKVGTGISATNVTTGTLSSARLDTDLQDLADGSLTATKIANATISNTEFQYLNGVTSAIQTQLNAKQTSGSYQTLDADLTDLADGSLTGSKVGTGISATNITTGTLSSARLDTDLQDLADGSLTATKIANGTISNTEFQYLNGVTSAIQTQLSDKGVPAGAVMTFDLAVCPSGWSELTTARGRYLVGKPSGGTLAGTTGTILTNLENRAVGQHNHGASSGNQSANHTHSHNHASVTSGGDSGHGHTLASGDLISGGGSNTGLAYGNKVGSGTGNLIIGSPTTAHTHTVNLPSQVSGGVSANHSHAITINNSGSVVGTNAPYIQLLVCKKN